MTEPIPEDYYLKPIEPDNQEKTKVMSSEEYKPDANFVALMDKALIEKLTKQLAKERELRKELVDTLKSVHKGTTFMHDDIELILQKAKE